MKIEEEKSLSMQLGVYLQKKKKKKKRSKNTVGVVFAAVFKLASGTLILFCD